jgi:hypothetical protein
VGQCFPILRCPVCVCVEASRKADLSSDERCRMSWNHRFRNNSKIKQARGVHMRHPKEKKKMAHYVSD